MVTCAEATDSYREVVKAAWIASDAAKVRERLRGGLLYGRPVDLEDADMVIAAAYYMGYLEALGIGKDDIC